VKLNVHLNGQSVELSAPGEYRLSTVLTKECRGINKECNNEGCGSCLILIDDFPFYSCQIPFFTVKDKRIMTIDGAVQDPIFSDIISGFKKAELNICDHCAPARVLSVMYLLKKSFAPTQKETEEVIHSIRCTCSSHTRLQRAIYYALEAKNRRLHG